MKKSLIVAFVLSLIWLPVYAAQSLPAGSGLSFAMEYYKQHVVAGVSCPNTVAINARNKSAILQAAMPGYATLPEDNLKHFSAYFSGAVHARCTSTLAGLPSSIVDSITQDLQLSDEPLDPNACPELQAEQKQAYELYLEALAAKALWDTVDQSC